MVLFNLPLFHMAVVSVETWEVERVGTCRGACVGLDGGTGQLGAALVVARPFSNLPKGPFWDPDE